MGKNYHISNVYALVDPLTHLPQLEEYFGKEVEEIVKECTDDKTLPAPERKRLQIETAPHKSVKVVKRNRKCNI